MENWKDTGLHLLLLVILAGFAALGCCSCQEDDIFDDIQQDKITKEYTVYFNEGESITLLEKTHSNVIIQQLPELAEAYDGYYIPRASKAKESLQKVLGCSQIRKKGKYLTLDGSNFKLPLSKVTNSSGDWYWFCFAIDTENEALNNRYAAIMICVPGELLEVSNAETGELRVFTHPSEKDSTAYSKIYTTISMEYAMPTTVFLIKKNE